MLKKRLLKVKILLVMLCAFNIAHAQLKTVTGTVKDEKGTPLANATVSATGAKAVKTAADGTFSISVPPATTSLVVSNAEFKDKTIDITNLTTVEVQLTRNVTELADVTLVNVGYGTQKVKDVTGAISSVKGADIKNLPTQDVATALQGRVAGVDVVTSSGQPGQTSQITIRGVSSLNEPNPLYIVDGVQQQDGNNINPADIETLTVLKDASAAAIYGSAAAGGVILITTKKGKGAKPTINFDTRYSVTTPELVPLLDKNRFVDFEKDKGDPYFTNPASQGYPANYIDSLTPVDWEKELYRNGTEQNYNLSISGATPNVNYFLSGIYNKQQGVFLQNSSELAGARINTDIKISNSIKVGEQMNAWSRNTIPVKTGVISTPFLTQPVFTGPVYSTVPGGTYGVYPFIYQGFNSVAQINSANFTFPETNFQGQVYLEAKLPVKYLTFKATFGYTSQSYQNNLFEQGLLTNGRPLLNVDGSASNTLYRNIGEYKQTLNAYVLAYDHTWGKLTLNLLGGYEQYASVTDNLQASVPNVLGTSFGYINSSLSLNNQTVTGGYDANGLVKSTFGRVHFNYNQKYDLEFTVRRDGNFTTFGPGQQYGVFPAVSGAWNIGEEHFFKKIHPIVNSLKLRASYGELGNSNIGTYHFIESYNQGFSQNFTPGGSAQIAYTQQAFPNANIQWESTHETNIGVDGEALNGKIYFTIDWYLKNTTGLLYNVPIAFSSGLPPTGDPTTGTVQPGTYLENIGAVRNTGLDIALGYKGSIGKVNYSVGGTGSFNKNKVLNLDGSGVTSFTDGNNNYPYAAGNSIWGGSNLTYTAPGLPFGQFYGLKSLGIISNATQLAQANIAQPGAKLGDLMYYDKNHDGQITAADDTTIGNPYPKFTFGINITASWKQWDIAMLFNGVLGAQLYNGVTPYEFESENNSNVTSKVFEASGFIHDGVTNGITKYPSISHYSGSGTFQSDPNGNYTQPSSFFVENGDYLKLKNLQIGYSLPSKILERFKIKSLRFFVMTNNVFAITKYTGVDPELGSQFSSLNLSPQGLVTGNANGTASAANGGVTNRGIDGPAKYPSVKLFAAGLDLSF
jgi:TonB-dependent starch-binding outer membrane protein SusC